MMDSVTGEAFSFICFTFLLGFASTIIVDAKHKSHSPLVDLFICVSQDLIFYFTLQLKMQLRIRYRVSVKLNTQNQFSSSPD